MKCEQPDWDKLLTDCKEIIEKKFKDYGNSWIELKPNHHFWMQRLEGEFNEWARSRHTGEPEEIQKELCDIINVCAMIYTNLEKEKQSELASLFG